MNSAEKSTTIPELKLEDLLSGFEGYQNHFEWPDTPLAGEEM